MSTCSDLSFATERIMRTLCSAHIFAEVQENHFANNTISASLVDNEPFRAYIVAQYVPSGSVTFCSSQSQRDRFVLCASVKAVQVTAVELPLTGSRKTSGSLSDAV